MWFRYENRVTVSQGSVAHVKVEWQHLRHDSEGMAAKRCMLQELVILECNKWICKKKKRSSEQSFLIYFNFLKFVNHKDTRNTECGIKVTFIPDVAFFHSVLVYNMTKRHIIGS